MTQAASRPRGGELFELIREFLPEDSSRQMSAWRVTEGILPLLGGPAPRVMDLGCGAGNSVDLFRRTRDDVSWVGVDIESSPEVRARLRKDADFVSYDGINLPFGDESFDLVYSSQVFEHVRHPEPLLREIRRVLKPGGRFVGSVSQLEPYHSYSVWNMTPYGLLEMSRDAGLAVIRLRPSIDGLTLITRRLFGSPRFFSVFWHRESPLNALISLTGRLFGKSH